jgi:hypothetical protein
MAYKRAMDVEITEPKPVYQRIAWWIENAFVRIFKRVFNSLKDGVQDMIALALGESLEDMEQVLIDDLRPLLDEMAQIDELPSWAKQVIANARSGQHQAEVLLLVPFVMALVGILSSGMSQAISPAVTHTFNRLLRLQLVDSFTAVELYRRKIVDDNDLKQLTRSNGWPDWQTELMKQLSEVVMNEGDLLNAYWRGDVSEGKVNEQLGKRGYSPEYIDLWKKLSVRIPSPGDLISIAVREGFDDAVATRFGYDEAFPGEAAEAAAKGGMPTEWFKRLWRSHWRLPSITQGFDMFHRGIMSQSDLELLMRAADVPSFWRSKLIQLSYNVVTRVDVRRMYALGVLSIEEVYQSYQAQGYTPDDAAKMTEWTVAEYAEEERELTKSDILGMYRDSVLNENEASGYLTALGYEEATIGLLLVREDLRKAADYEKEVVTNIKSGFMANIYDENDVRAELGKLDPPAGYVDDLLELWKLEKRRRLTRPTVTQLRDMWLTQVINDNELQRELEGRGYSELYIDWYKALWTEE